MKIRTLRIVALFPLINQIELIDIYDGTIFYWKLGTALNCRMYSIGEKYQVKGTEITKMESEK